MQAKLTKMYPLPPLPSPEASLTRPQACKTKAIAVFNFISFIFRLLGAGSD